MQGYQSEIFYFFNFNLLFYFKISYYYCTGDMLWHLQKFLQYIIVEFTPYIK
jgi:hypothetical protein